MLRNPAHSQSPELLRLVLCALTHVAGAKALVVQMELGMGVLPGTMGLESDMMRLQWGTWVVLALLILAGVGRADEAAAVKVVLDAGGTVMVDDKHADKPVITVVLWGPEFKVEILKSLKEFKSMQRLRIGGPWITDEGLKPLKELKGLQKLEIRSPHVTDAALKEIQDALPDCKIRRASPGDDK